MNMPSAVEWDPLIESWRTRQGLSGHTRLEVAASRSGEPLAPDAPVPGCACPRCTGVPEDDPAPGQSEPDGADRRLPVEKARQVSILALARRLDLGTPRKRGGEHLVRCPLHDDTDPSLSLNAEKGLWYCWPCGQGGDGIDLVMDCRGLQFPDAVKWIVRARS